MAVRVIAVYEPPVACVGCRFYDKYRDDCKSVFWHLMKEHRNANIPCPSKAGPAHPCTGNKCYTCTPGIGCDS